MIVLGSHAMFFGLVRHGGTVYRTSSDVDFLCTYDQFEQYIKNLKSHKIIACYPADNGNKYIVKCDNNHIMEFEIAWEGTNQESLMEIIKNDPSTGYTNSDFMYASLDVLLMLKLSHRYKKNSPHFHKTMKDIHALRSAGAVMRPEWAEWFSLREKETYTNHLPKLNTSKDKFFKDDFYVYDHDSIHEAVKHLDKPAYEYFKPADSQVMVSKPMWDDLDEQTKLYAVLEESYVLALERSQIPFPETDRRKSFDMALEKVCTSITSGWFREYAWENYYTVSAMYDEKYIDKFKMALDNGRILPFKGEYK